MSTTAAIYTRISSDPSGERAGVERQRSDCERLAAAMGLTDLRLYEDNDVSAYSGKARPMFERLLQDVASGSVGTVIVWAADRLYRQLADLERIVPVLERAGVDVHAVKSGNIDLSTADGRMYARMTATVALHESEKKSERITARARQRALDEKRLIASHLPFGWRWVDPDPGNPLRPRPGSRAGVEPDPVTSRLLAAAYQDVADGHTLLSAYRRLGAVTDVGRMMPSTLGVILRNPRNGGLVTYRGEVVGDAADGHRIVEPELFWQVHAILSNPARRTSPGRPANTLLGGGLLRCGICGGPMASGRKAGAPSYVCSRYKHLTRSRTLLDDIVTDAVGDVIESLAGPGLMAVIEEPEETPGADIRARIAKQEAKLDALHEALAADQLDVRDFTAAVKRLRAAIDADRDHLGKVDSRPGLVRLAESEAPRSEWERLAADDKPTARIILRELLDRIVAETDRSLTYYWDIGDLAPTSETLPSARRLPTRRDDLSEQFGRPISQVIEELRAKGLSWRAVAREIGVRSGTPIGHTTVQKYALPGVFDIRENGHQAGL